MKAFKFSLAFIIIMIGTISMAGGIELFKTVDFRGVKNLDRISVLKKSNARIVKGAIAVDIDALEEVLKKEIILSKYSISKEGSILIVEVEEKYPLFMLLVVDNSQSIPTLVDEKNNILESGLFFKTDMPIIILRRDFLALEDGYSALLNLFELLKNLQVLNPTFAGELEEIFVNSKDSIRVKLKKRATYFIVKMDSSGFLRMEKTAAYLDSVSKYPEALDLRGNMVLVK